MEGLVTFEVVHPSFLPGSVAEKGSYEGRRPPAGPRDRCHPALRRTPSGHGANPASSGSTDTPSTTTGYSRSPRSRPCGSKSKTRRRTPPTPHNPERETEVVRETTASLALTTPRSRFYREPTERRSMQSLKLRPEFLSKYMQATAIELCNQQNSGWGHCTDSTELLDITYPTADVQRGFVLFLLPPPAVQLSSSVNGAGASRTSWRCSIMPS